MPVQSMKTRGDQRSEQLGGRPGMRTAMEREGKHDQGAKKRSARRDNGEAGFPGKVYWQRQSRRRKSPPYHKLATYREQKGPLREKIRAQSGNLRKTWSCRRGGEPHPAVRKCREGKKTGRGESRFLG